MEKPDPEDAPSNLAIMGRFIFEPEIFEFLERIPPGKTGEYELTEAIRQMIPHHPVYACPIDGEWHTVGDLLSYLKTTVAFSLSHPTIGNAFREFLLSTQERVKPST